MARLDDWDDDPSGTDTPTDDPDLASLRYPTVDRFVVEFLAEVLWFDTTSSARIWCPQWWKHPAAIVRLEALHRAFEQLRQDAGLGISIWLRDHADPHMTVLTEPNGPFKGCSVAKGHDERTRVIDVDSPPASLFETGD